jgi:hypothetical protein
MPYTGYSKITDKFQTTLFVNLFYTNVFESHVNNGQLIFTIISLINGIETQKLLSSPGLGTLS